MIHDILCNVHTCYILMARLHKATPGVSLRSFVAKLGNQTVGDSGIHIKD